ncbi:unnamed protein product [Spirodela intermedia]|uniref:Uncharacterized protein n=1 Tax=Spirodela intermedia TaxID=51605 RepID=A0A7I8K482_SPIIN|nr:unnamed protein product [Spirodela intermedia]
MEDLNEKIGEYRQRHRHRALSSDPAPSAPPPPSPGSAAAPPPAALRGDRERVPPSSEPSLFPRGEKVPGWWWWWWW